MIILKDRIRTINGQFGFGVRLPKNLLPCDYDTNENLVELENTQTGDKCWSKINDLFWGRTVHSGRYIGIAELKEGIYSHTLIETYQIIEFSTKKNHGYYSLYAIIKSMGYNRPMEKDDFPLNKDWHFLPGVNQLPY